MPLNEDAPNDQTSPPADLNQPAPATPRIQSSVTVQDNKGTAIGVQNIFNQPSLAPALHQLRAPIGDFVGREREIDQLVQALSKAASGGTAAAISGVRGMGGIGKTELAYMVAQRLSARFPDAQLLVELGGASSSPLTPQQALQRIILSFEREATLPDDLDQLQALYRDKLTTKRALILADDAKDATQVRPLLPPAGCALLITSRNRFSVPGMAALDLGTLPLQEAEQLLLLICPRIGEQVSTLAKLCGYLPLALQVSASLLANSSRSVARYLEQLAAERLKHLSDPDDPHASVKASLRLSYDALEGAAQAALAQMSVFATSFDLAAALAVVQLEGDVEAFVDLLVRRNLLEWDEQLQRFSLHELVRVFAAAQLEDTEAVRLRHARHYAEVAAQAEKDLYLKGEALAGLTLFDRERTHIDAGWRWARERGGDSDADALLLEYANATVIIGLLRYDTRRARIPQLEAWLGAARRLDCRSAEGTALGSLGIANVDLGNAQKAIEFFEQDLVIAREIGNRRGEGQALGGLGLAHAALGNMRKAIEFYEQRLGIACEIADRRGEEAALGNLGMAYAALGNTQKAIGFSEQHLAVAREIGDRRGEGAALGNLGSAYAALGEACIAIDFYEQRLAIARELGDRRGEGNALSGLGLAYYSLGDAQRAITFHEQHLAIARGIDDRRGEAMASWNLGLGLEKQGDLTRAAELMQVYVDFFGDIGHPDTEKHTTYLEQLRQRLADGDSAPVVGEGAEG